jgi:amino acid adenylation domain-containing protein
VKKTEYLRTANNSPDFHPLDSDYQLCSLPEYFDRVANRHPQLLAIADDQMEYSFHDAFCRTNQLANLILSHKIHGQVAVFLPNCANLAVAFWGIMKAGCAAVMIDTALPSDRVQFLLQDAQVSAIVTNEAYQNLLPDDRTGPVLLFESLQDYPAELSQSIKILVDNPAVLVYTSGSTGTPKGVLHSHRAWMASIGWVAQCEKYVPEDRIAQVYSPSSAASLIGIVYALLSGASIHMFDTDKHSLPYFVDWIEERKISAFRMTGTAFRQVFSGTPQPEKVKSIRLAMIGGEMIHKEDHKIFQQWFPRTALQRVGGGATEVLLIASCYLDHESIIESSHVPMGFVFDPITVEIWDENGHPVPVGTAGEIVVRGPSVALGYWHQDPYSGGFCPDPDDSASFAYRMGDLGYISENGLLFITGRKDQMVKVRGYRVEVAEVEANLRHVPGVKQAVVVAAPHRAGSSQLIAYIVPEIQDVPSIRKIQSVLSEKLPKYMLPARYIFLKQLPVNTTGKVNQSALPPPGTERPELETPFTAPRNYMEMELTKIWSEVLGIDPIGIDDDFLLLGGDSLAAAQIFMLAEEAVNTKFPPALLLNSPTIRELAGKMFSYRKDREDAMIVLQEGLKDSPTLFLFTPLLGDAIIYRDIVSFCPPELRIVGLHSWTKDQRVYSSKSIDEMLDEFLPLMLEDHPQGPFYLGGFSLGGALAYQAAYRLQQSGKKIGFVFLLDSIGPGVVNKFDLVEYIQGFLRQKTLRDRYLYLRRGFIKVFQSVKTKLIRVKAENKTKIVKATNPSSVPYQTQKSSEQEIRKPISPQPQTEYVPYTVLKVSYAAPKCDLDVILFTSDVRAAARKGAGYALGWNRVVKGTLQVFHIPGSHDDHFRGENAKKIVDVLLANMP